MNLRSHSDFMSLALQLAQQGRLTVSPNPMVGCLIVKNGHIIGQGFHQQAGEPHAEIHALHQAGVNAAGSTAYVTLEPCCFYQRTPPCTDAFIRAGVKKIMIACQDPHPQVAGKGIVALQAAGIQVEVGIGEAEATKLNEIFFHYIQHQRPFVIAKWAMSLDGKMITHPLDTRDISSPAARCMTHETRQQVDAILIGAKTAIHDNPLLTARSSNIATNWKQPTRIILANNSLLPAHLKLWDPALPAKTIVATTASCHPLSKQMLLDKNIEVMTFPHDQPGKVCLMSLLNELGKRKITSLLIEGGKTIHESFFNANLINQIQVYLAPVIIGSLEKKRPLSNVHFSQIARDFYFQADDVEEYSPCLVE